MTLHLKLDFLKETVHPKTKNLSSFTHPHVVTKPYDFLLPVTQKKSKFCGKYQGKLVDYKPMQVYQITSKTHNGVQMLNRLREHALKTKQEPPVTLEWHSSTAEWTAHPLAFALL